MLIVEFGGESLLFTMRGIIHWLQGVGVEQQGQSDESDSVTDFATREGMIGLLLRDRAIQFEINLKRVRRSGLEVHSNLLSLATIVEPPNEDRR